MKKLIGNGFTNELYYFASCVIIVVALSIGGCGLHDWYIEAMKDDSVEHVEDMGIWAEDKEIVATEGTFPKVTEK